MAKAILKKSQALEPPKACVLHLPRIRGILLLSQRLKQSIQSSQGLVMNQAMQYALNILQCASHELDELVQREVEKNPFLECSFFNLPLETAFLEDPSFKKQQLVIELKAALPQKEHFILDWILGQVNSLGILNLTYKEAAKILNVTIKRFIKVKEAIEKELFLGFASENLSELLKTRLQWNKKHPGYVLLESLINENQQPQICTLKEEERKALLKEVRFVHGFMKTFSCKNYHPHFQIDIHIQKQNDRLQVTSCDESIPTIYFSKNYELMSGNKDLQEEYKSFFRKWLASSLWLKRCLSKRKKILLALAEFQCTYNYEYLTGNVPYPKAISGNALQEMFSIHVSTIHRALKNKWIQTPIGILPFRSLFPRSMAKNSTFSKEEAIKCLKEMIARESKPLSDEELTKALLKQGIRIARRTVSKYRKEIGIGNTADRKRT